MGLTTSVSGNHSIRFRNKWMWITPSGISRYKIDSNHIVKVQLRTSKAFGNIRPSIELNLHRNIYNTRQDVNAIVHTHSPFTIGVSISSDRKSTRLNSSHANISYAVFCLKKNNY